MHYIVESRKSFALAAVDPEAAAPAHGSGSLLVHKLGISLRSKAILFAETCKA